MTRKDMNWDTLRSQLSKSILNEIEQNEDSPDEDFIFNSFIKSLDKKIESFEEQINCDEVQDAEITIDAIGIKNTLSNENLSAKNDRKRNGLMFGCENCITTFTEYRNLVRHMQNLHCQIPKHTCRRCSFKALSVDVLKQHENDKKECDDNLDKIVPTFECLLCSRKYRALNKLNDHKRRCNNKQANNNCIPTFECPLCSTKYITLTKLNDHKRRYHLKVWKCQQCESRYGSRFQLKVHQDGKHNGIVYKCNICENVYTTKVILRNHIKRTHVLKDYKCNQCNFETKTKDRLLMHQTTVHGLPEYKCNHCIKKFTTIINLRRHEMSHNEIERKHKCLLCDYKAKAKNELERHKQTVHEGRKFYCDTCSFSCSDYYNLKIHDLSIHQKKFDYECDQCTYKTVSKKRLNEHKRKKHENIIYSCSKCEANFDSDYRFKQHKRNQHQEIVMHYCDQCNYSSVIADNLRKHIKQRHSEKLKCTKCLYETPYKNLLKQHTDFVHDGGGFRCQICGSFKSRKNYLKEHMEKKHNTKLL